MVEAVAAILVKRKKMIEKLRKVGASSPETAVAAEKAGIYEGYILNDLIKQGKVRKTEDNRYYVCEDMK
jgi:hypothetical protein